MGNLTAERTGRAPVRVALHGVPGSESLRGNIRADFDLLKDQYPGLGECRVAVELVNGDVLPGYCAHLELRLPQRQILVSGEVSATSRVALRKALEAARLHLAMPPY